MPVLPLFAWRQVLIETVLLYGRKKWKHTLVPSRNYSGSALRMWKTMCFITDYKSLLKESLNWKFVFLTPNIEPDSMRVVHWQGIKTLRLSHSFFVVNSDVLWQKAKDVLYSDQVEYSEMDLKGLSENDYLCYSAAIDMRHGSSHRTKSLSW